MLGRESQNVCTICLRRFDGPRQLYLHLKTHYGDQHQLGLPDNHIIRHGPRSKLYRCSICMDNWTSLRRLYGHLAGHFVVGPRASIHQHFARDAYEPVRTFNHIGGGKASKKRAAVAPPAPNSDSPVRPRKKLKGPAPDHTHAPQPGPSRVGKEQLPQPGPSRGGNEQLPQDRAGNDDDDDDDDPQPGDVSDQEDDTYHFERVSSRSLKSMKVDEVTYRVHVPVHVQGMFMSDALRQIYNMFDHALRHIKKGMKPHHRIRVVIMHPLLHVPIHIKASSPEDLTPEVIMAAIEKVLQSESKLPLDNQLRMVISTLKPMGGGRGRRHFVGAESSAKKKRSVVSIENPDDNLCLERAIVVCMAKLKGSRVNKKKWQRIIHKKLKCQHQEAVKLRRSVGIDGDRPATVQDIKTYEEHLDVQIVVISAQHFNSVVYAGSRRRYKKIFLLQDRDHFHSIISMAGFLGSNSYCETCLKAVHNREHHNCATSCAVCSRENCLVQLGGEVLCPDCNHACRSRQCYDQHKSRTSVNGRQLKLSYCEKYWRCPDCCTVLQRKKRQPELHQCGEHLCPSCQKYVVGRHLCYQRSEQAKSANSRCVWLDYESRQDSLYACPLGYSKPAKCSQGCPDDTLCQKCTLCQNCQDTACGQCTVHTPNYCICITSCEACIDDPEPLGKHSKCPHCGSRCATCNKRDAKGGYRFPPLRPLRVQGKTLCGR